MTRVRTAPLVRAPSAPPASGASRQRAPPPRAAPSPRQLSETPGSLVPLSWFRRELVVCWWKGLDTWIISRRFFPRYRRADSVPGSETASWRKLGIDQSETIDSRDVAAL
jgi:hypothetical protein